MPEASSPGGSSRRATVRWLARFPHSRRASSARWSSDSSIFLRDENGKRPVYGGTKKFQEDPYWKDYILFYEYFHGDNGAGLGASHQTGWTGIIARSLDMFARIKSEDLLQSGKADIMARMTREQVAG